MADLELDISDEQRVLEVPSLASMAKFMRQISDDRLIAEARRRGIVTPPKRRKRGTDDAQLAIGGLYRMELYGPDDALKDCRVVKNLVVDAGLNWIREYGFDSVTPTTMTRMSRIAIGTGTNAVTSADTTLQTESARQVFTAATGYVAGGTGVVTVLTTFAAGTGTGAVTEAAVLNAAAMGDMWNRVVFAAVNKGAGDTLKVTVTMTFTAA